MFRPPALKRRAIVNHPFGMGDSMMPRRLVNRDNVKWTDGVRDAFFSYDHNCLGMNSDEILMRHSNLFSTRQFQGERMKTVLQPTSDLLDTHGDDLASGFIEAMLILVLSPRRRSSAPAR